MATAPLVLRLLICLAYFGVGSFVMINRPFNSQVFDLLFAFACFAYGAFRAYRAIKNFKDQTDET